VLIELSSFPFCFILSSSPFSILTATIILPLFFLSSPLSLSSPEPDSPLPASSPSLPSSPPFPPSPSSFSFSCVNAARIRNDCQPPFFCTAGSGPLPSTYLFRSHYQVDVVYVQLRTGRLCDYIQQGL
jgi:hypothetical protein